MYDYTDVILISQSLSASHTSVDSQLQNNKVKITMVNFLSTRMTLTDPKISENY